MSLLDVKLEITLGSLSHDDAFELDTVLALDAGSDGIDPTTEDVTLQVGSYTVTVGAGSFAPDRNGRIVFEGIIDDVLLEIAFRPASGGITRSRSRLTERS